MSKGKNHRRRMMIKHLAAAGLVYTRRAREADMVGFSTRFLDQAKDCAMQITAIQAKLDRRGNRPPRKPKAPPAPPKGKRGKERE